jgi:tRNA dimethylallyltransferase
MEELAACDPASAARIHPNDAYRIQRALEVFRSSGRPRSSYHPTEAAPRSQYRFLILGLERGRAETYRRIDDRCAQMFRQGLREEVARLRAAGYGPTDPGMKAIGYREFFAEDIPSDGGEVQALVARNSRRYAKRQITFFASIPRVKWVSATGDPEAEIRRELAGFLGE